MPFSSPAAGRILLPALAAACVFSAVNAHAQSRFEEEFDNQEKPWQEIALQLPAPPRPENLAPFYINPTASQDFAVDLASVALGSDGVIRYTVLATSEGGVRNISYEGIRCATYEKKLYAFGREDGSWSRARRDQWERISGGVNNHYHATLAQDYFCENKTVAGEQRDMVQRLRNRQPLGKEKYR